MKNMSKIVMTILLLSLTACTQDSGLVNKKSAHTAKATIDRLQSLLKQKGITVALRWSHSDRAKAAGIELRPTELIIFGNPKLGSHMFTSKQSAGIDLPMKVLAWEDEQGQTWVAYNEPGYLARRHGIKDRAEIINKMSAALQQLTDKAAAP